MRCVSASFVGGFLLVSGSIAMARPVVVELFTSEGCSSCPPADAYLTELTRNGSVLPLAFHVTYWNRLGWRDPYSLETATVRQANYASRLSAGGSFTPQMVVDGRRSAVGSDRAEVAPLIAQAAAAAARAISVRVVRRGGDVAIDIGAGHGQGSVLLIGFDRQHATPVNRGENAGRTLTESNIVRGFRKVGDWSGSSLHLVAGAPPGEDLAVLVQDEAGHILAAARLDTAS